MKKDQDGSAIASPALRALESFCSKDTSRDSLLRPFALGGKTYATDGKIGVAVPGELVPPSSDAKIANLFAGIVPIIETARADASAWVRLTSIPPAEICEACKGIPQPERKEECPECGGFGEVELSSDYNEYTCDCKTCDGDGTVKEEGCASCDGVGLKHGARPVYCGIQGAWFDLLLLQRIASLSGLRLGIHDPGRLSAHYFTWDDGEGVLMPLRAKREDDGEYPQAHVEYELTSASESVRPQAEPSQSSPVPPESLPQ